MTVKRRLSAAIESLPEDMTLSEALSSIARIARIQQALAVPDADPDEDLSPDERARLQMAVAGRHPGEYVVLVGREILFHGPDKAAAFSVYQAAQGRSDGRYPVMVVPEPRPPVTPVFRGRTLVTG